MDEQQQPFYTAFLHRFVSCKKCRRIGPTVHACISLLLSHQLLFAWCSLHVTEMTRTSLLSFWLAVCCRASSSNKQKSPFHCTRHLDTRVRIHPLVAVAHNFQSKSKSIYSLCVHPGWINEWVLEIHIPLKSLEGMWRKH